MRDRQGAGIGLWLVSESSACPTAAVVVVAAAAAFAIAKLIARIPAAGVRHPRQRIADEPSDLTWNGRISLAPPNGINVATRASRNGEVDQWHQSEGKALEAAAFVWWRARR
jgi:hypothetical protein